MNWTILGIPATKDKAAITAAYRARLPQVNPEDRPEEFKALRAAYEEAIRLAETGDVIHNSPVDLWMDQVAQVYDCFPARLDPDSWQDLLAGDVCHALDTRPQAEEALLRFLMAHYYLPQKVWQMLDGEFRWTERRQELYERYPRDFIDYAVIGGIRSPENLPLNLFFPGQDAQACDRYRDLYFQAGREDLDALVRQLEALPERHPYGELLACQRMMAHDREQALAGYQRLADAYPDDSRLQLEWAAQCMKNGDPVTAEQYARRSLDAWGGNPSARELLADSLARQQRFEEARTVLLDLLDLAGGNQRRIHSLQDKLRRWNQALIPQWEARLNQNPEEDETRSKLGWALLQNGRPEEVLELCRQFRPAYPDGYDYHNLYFRTLWELGRPEEALPHMDILLEMLGRMPPDGTRKTDDRIASLGSKLQMKGVCLLSLNRKEEAEEAFEKALAASPEDPAVLTGIGRLFLKQGKAERAVTLFAHLVTIQPEAYQGYYFLARGLFALGRDRDAFDAVNRALEIEGSDLGVYLLKMQILLRNGVWAEVRDTLTFLREHGVTDEINTLWCEGQLLELGENKKDEALSLYQAIARRLEAGESMMDPAQLYFRMLVLEGQRLDAREEADRAKLLALAEKGLSYDPQDPDCLDYQAWLLEKDGKPEQAMEIYHRLEANPRFTRCARRGLASLYYKDLDRWAAQALDYYAWLLEDSEESDDHFYAGTCCRYLGRYKEGEAHFLRLLELSPDDIDGYRGLSFLYECMGRYEDALTQINKAIAIAQQREWDSSRYYRSQIRILRRLGRPREAVQAVQTMTEQCGNSNAFQDQFDIYCQFALWDEAAGVLRQWEKHGKKNARLDAARIDLALFSGDLEKARTLFSGKKRLLSSKDKERLELLLAELDGDEEPQMSIWNRRLESWNDPGYALMNMAQVQWWSGHFQQARDYAARALLQIEESIPKNKDMEALYRGRRSILLAILGRMEEARAELAAVRALPLCDFCCYGRCKDADIFEANFEEITGNYRRAMALHQAGRQRWPDDMDFAAGINRMKRKGVAEP